MQYVAGNIHGNFEAYLSLLDEISFKDTDILYVLGDALDYGGGSIEILQDMMLRPNIIPILGEHEYMAYQVFKALIKSPEDAMKNPRTLKMAEAWMKKGGEKTLSAFMALNDEQKDDILDFLEEFTVWEEVEASGKTFLLLHGGFKEFQKDKSLDDYKISEILTGSIEPDKTYFEDKYIVCSHIPAHLVSGTGENKIFVSGNNIFIDCDCRSSGTLGAYCLTNGKEFYVNVNE